MKWWGRGDVGTRGEACPRGGQLRRGRLESGTLSVNFCAICVICVLLKEDICVDYNHLRYLRAIMKQEILLIQSVQSSAFDMVAPYPKELTKSRTLRSSTHKDYLHCSRSYHELHRIQH